MLNLRCYILASLIAVVLAASTGRAQQVGEPLITRHWLQADFDRDYGSVGDTGRISYQSPDDEELTPFEETKSRLAALWQPEAILPPRPESEDAAPDALMLDATEETSDEAANGQSPGKSKDSKTGGDKDKNDEKKDEKKEKKDKKWYDRISIRGYGQFRYNQIGATNPDLRSPFDRSVGENQGFFLRRARMVFSGEAGEHVNFYIQPDFASTVGDQLHFLQMRDFYADVFLDPCKEHRIRFGQSKIPYGWENLQSSQNRITFDRADALNTGAPNERDIGVFYYYAPDYIRDRFKYLVDSGLKGSGDYGVFGVGLYNGQSANRPELNDNRHSNVHVTWPFLLSSGQIVEAGMSGYTGEFVIARSAGVGGGDNFDDHRLAWHLIYYPQPFGFQAEYTIGEGPELNAAGTAVEERSLHGGYGMLYYKYHEFLPYVRFQHYRGGNKTLVNSPQQNVDETELGVEWQPGKALEITVAYMISQRASLSAPYGEESGSLLRLQAQFNY